MAGLHLSKDPFGRFPIDPLPASKEYFPVTKSDTTHEIFQRFSLPYVFTGQGVAMLSSVVKK
jgi:hypothetical protein